MVTYEDKMDTYIDTYTETPTWPFCMNQKIHRGRGSRQKQRERKREREGRLGERGIHRIPPTYL